MRCWQRRKPPPTEDRITESEESSAHLEGMVDELESGIRRLRALTSELMAITTERRHMQEGGHAD